ncbi:hypothetical protein AX17_005547 [Amanita inopinata Kibby_2008]|nr:hypothetical protein AX17_005547 [Amanita inopinata Kibby_2008]
MYCLEVAPEFREVLFDTWTNVLLVYKYGGEAGLRHYRHFLSNKEHNKLQHALNSNRKGSSPLESVPTLDGSNYPIWAEAMKSYLKFSGLWQTTAGGAPTVPDYSKTNDAGEIFKWQMIQNEINNKDDAAVGAILLQVSPSIKDQLKDFKTAKECWDHLATSLNKPGPAQIFGDFRQVIAFRFSGNQNPDAEIPKLALLFGKLGANSVTIDPFLQSMILLNAIPPKWDHLVSTFLSTKKKDDIKFDDICSILVAEFHRQTTMQGIKPAKANKISGAQHKKQDPKWKKDKKDKGKKKEEGSSEKSDDKKKEWKEHGGRRQKKQTASVTETSQVLSFTAPTMVHPTIISQQSMIDSRPTRSPQTFQQGTPTKVSIETVKTLEQRLLKDESPRPLKRARTDDEVSLGDESDDDSLEWGSAAEEMDTDMEDRRFWDSYV